MKLDSAMPAISITRLKEGDFVQCRAFPTITGTVLLVCAHHQILVRAPYGKVLDDARSWTKTNDR